MSVRQFKIVSTTDPLKKTIVIFIYSIVVVAFLSGFPFIPNELFLSVLMPEVEILNISSLNYQLLLHFIMDETIQ